MDLGDHARLLFSRKRVQQLKKNVKSYVFLDFEKKTLKRTCKFHMPLNHSSL